MEGQTTIDGHEVGDSYLNLPSLGTVLWEAPADWKPQRGDQIEVVTRYVIDDISYPLKHNKKGVNVEGMKETISTTPIVPDTIQIRGVLTAQEIEDAWERAHQGQEQAG